jgi:hypothetical protein
MSIFRDFFVKEKPVFTGITRGVGGFGFGGGGASLTGASGGIKFSSPSYTYHIFVQGDTTNFTAHEPLGSCHVLCVGGGGGGANGQGGGGGGSSVGHLANTTLPAATYAVTVGAGGATAPGPADPYSLSGDKGGDSTFGGTTVYGGGGGLRNNYGWNGNPSQPGLGGNAGGGGGGSLSGPGVLSDGVVASQPGGPLGFTIYGANNGAPSASVGDGSGGGGGGAGGASPGPSNPRPSSSASPGGAGQPIGQFPGPGIYPHMPSPLQSTLGTPWRDAVGPTGLYGGGGGGGDDNTSDGGGAGGPGGGGAGGDTNTSSGNGIDGTGGGAGDLGKPSFASNSGGGDGIVIVRYPV